MVYEYMCASMCVCVHTAVAVAAVTVIVEVVIIEQVIKANLRSII